MDFSNVHILLCDHDPSTGSKTLALLQKCSYKVTQVKSARQVVDALKSGSSNVDVVLTDVELPKGKGFKMLKYLLRRDDLGHVAVVVMSEHDEMAVVAKCLSLGAVDYLVKPLRLNEVMNLWTHMWRKRRLMKLPDKQVGILSSSECPNVQKPGQTVDLLSGYKNSEAIVPATDAWHTVQPEELSGSGVELSLRLSLSCKAGKRPGHLPDASLSPHPCVGDGKDLASSTKLRPCNQQPDEQSATNACSSSNAPSKRSKYSSECVTNGNQDAMSEVPADASRYSCKEVSGADETRLGEKERPMPDIVYQSSMEQVSPPFIAADEMICHGGRTSPLHVQGFRPWYAFMGWPPSNLPLGETASVPEAPTPRYDLAVCPPPGQAFPVYYHNAGVATMPPGPNAFPCYTVAHLAVPVVNFPTWPAIISPPPLVGGKLIQAERREAALSKFRMKRKGRCFEKKIRYASRKKLAEQRPRVRGQFVKRTILIENVETQAAFDEDGEVDDEEGCSEVENQSSLDCVAENSNGG